MIVNFLNLELANKYIVLTKTKSHHWNVIDPRFKGLYEFLKEQYNMFHEKVEEFVDGIRPIRGRPIGTIREFIDKPDLLNILMKTQIVIRF